MWWYSESPSACSSANWMVARRSSGEEVWLTGNFTLCVYSSGASSRSGVILPTVARISRASRRARSTREVEARVGVNIDSAFSGQDLVNGAVLHLIDPGAD